MTKRTATAQAKTLAGSGVLPSGGNLEVGLRGTTKTVDASISQLDRHRPHMVRKTREDSKIFKPLDPNEIPKNPARGKSLHSDPFAEDRPHFEFRRAKVKVQTPRGPARPERRIVKPVAPVERKVKDSTFISCTGTTHLSPKRVPKEKHATTHQKDQPAKSYVGNKRFALNPDKQAAVSSPSRSQPTPAMSDSAVLSMSGQPSARSISNVFPDQTWAIKQKEESVAPQRTGLRIDRRHVGQITMEGVFCPMRNGRAPKPSSLAPWLKDSAAPAPGRKAITGHTGVSQAPFAIEG
jgi:hypothetical protein